MSHFPTEHFTLCTHFPSLCNKYVTGGIQTLGLLMWDCTDSQQREGEGNSEGVKGCGENSWGEQSLQSC